MPWRVVELPQGPARVQAGTISTIFPTRQAALDHRAGELGDPDGARYEAIETDEVGRPVPVSITYTITRLPDGQYQLLGDQEPPSRFIFHARIVEIGLCDRLWIDPADAKEVLREIEAHGLARRVIRPGKVFTQLP
jgi:hypothetical protein